ncbi:MAG: hypothetical protein F4X32_03860 [Candidatus Dadabacteria bacterium]|nr:hypothetical protein [Candidatus Dadabacteria bacterium]
MKKVNTQHGKEIKPKKARTKHHIEHIPDTPENVARAMFRKADRERDERLKKKQVGEGGTRSTS